MWKNAPTGPFTLRLACKMGREHVPKGLLLLKDNILERGGLFTPRIRSSWAEGLDLPREGERLLFAGCGYQLLGETSLLLSAASRGEEMGMEWERALDLFSPLVGVGMRATELLLAFRGDNTSPLRAAVRVLEGMGYEVAYLGEEEPCCGGPLYFAGFRREFEGVKERLREALLRSGSREVIGAVPSCTYAIKELAQVPLEVKHLVEVYAEGMGGGRWRLPEPKKVVYHDPCILARYLGVVEEPRRVLEAIEGVELVEAPLSREWATCCGGGGGFEFVFPQVSLLLAKKRAEELLGTGAEVIVTACPGCLIQLRKGVKALGSSAEVLDMSEILLEAQA